MNRLLFFSAALLIALFTDNAARAQTPAASAAAIQTRTNTDAPQGGTIHGTVTSGKTPLPGVTITATNTLSGKKYSASTDVNGNFAMHIPGNGRFVLRSDFPAFAAATKEVLINASSTNQQADFTLVLTSRAESSDASAEGADGNGEGRRANRGDANTRLADTLRGALNLGILSANGDTTQAGVGDQNTGAALPSLAQQSNATDSVAVTGQTGTTSPFAGLDENQIREQFDNARTQDRGGIANFAGGPGGGGDGGGFGGGGFGRGFGGGLGSAFRKFNPNKPHGAIFYSGGNSALNAKNFSLDGTHTEQPSYNSNRFGVVFTGAPQIPYLLKPDTRNFIFLTLFGTKNSSPFDQYATVPTLAERAGNFQGLTNAAGDPVTIYDPQTGLPFADNTIPQKRITSQATALLQYLPPPNQLGSFRNYHRLTAFSQNTTSLGMRYVRNFGTGGGGAGLPPFVQAMMGSSGKGLRQNISINFNYNHSGSDLPNVFADLGGKNQTHQYSLTTGYTIGSGNLTNNLSVSWSRTHTEISNFFTNIVDVASNAGISGLSSNPFNYGVPNLVFSQFNGLNEQAPNFRINQTISFSDSSSWNHGKHNLRFGFDVRRIHLDLLGGTNVTGSFYFTGFATRQPGSPVTQGAQPSGADFADYLLGLPQEAAQQSGNDKYYLRANVWDVFFQDDWRLLPNFSVNYGLRYEYFSPYSEKFDRLANLDHNADFSKVAAVFPNGVGPFTGKFPHTLIAPDRNNFAPRFGFAWRAAKDTVVRGGYGINFSPAQYAGFINQLAYQPPFANTQTNLVNQGCPGITLANGFDCNTNPVATQNNFAINKNYRLGYVQVWNLGVQRTLPKGIVFNVDYNGSKGTHLDIVRAPNRSLIGVLDPNAQPYIFEDSLAFSNFSGLSLRVRKRLQHGVSMGATYQYGHSIDNASSIGGTATVVAQNDQDLLAEEGNSSFDIRHRVAGDFLYELPFGPNSSFLTSGWAAHTFNGLSLSTNYVFATGVPLTPRFSAAIADVARGTAGTLRPDRVPGSSLTAGAGSANHFFNTAAFSAPVAGDPNYPFGGAARNSIPGPGTVAIDMTGAKTVSLGDVRSLELRAIATNVFNTVQYASVDSLLGSRTFGAVLSAAPQRRITFSARYRF